MHSSVKYPLNKLTVPSIRTKQKSRKNNFSQLTAPHNTDYTQERWTDLRRSGLKTTPVLLHAHFIWGGGDHLKLVYIFIAAEKTGSKVGTAVYHGKKAQSFIKSPLNYQQPYSYIPSTGIQQKNN